MNPWEQYQETEQGPWNAYGEGNVQAPEKVVNEILIKNKRGKLFPFGIFRLLFGKKKTKTVRVLALGVMEEYRKMGIEAIFFAKNIKVARERGLIGGEASWILENNEPMRAAAEHLNGEKYKTYRLYKISV